MIWPFSLFQSKGATDVSLDALIRSLDEMYKTVSGINVTPETCMQSPTVQAVVTAISRRISVSPITVYQRDFDGQGHEQKTRLPNHPVAQLLSRPNEWQTRQNYLLDAASTLVRWGRFYAVKGRGVTGPIRRLWPQQPSQVSVQQSNALELTYRVTTSSGQKDYSSDEMHVVRGAARDYVVGDSPVTDVRESIALEIAIERFGAAFFGNGALPLMFFSAGQGFKDWKDDAERDKFLTGLREALSGKRAHSGFWLPKGIETKPVTIEADKQQLIESRKHQRTVIAGAFGVPPHFVGDLERATFNNVEQQDTDFVINVVLPVAQQFESAMERDLLTVSDRATGVIIRFNLDAIQRADFKTRQEGLQIQRQNGVISANEWREAEGRNPISADDGGEDYIFPANFQVAGEPPVVVAPPAKPNGQAQPNGQGDSNAA